MRPCRWAVFVLLLCAPLTASYVSTVTPDRDIGWWHFYYGGRDDGWSLTPEGGLAPGSGTGASYYYDCCPAWRNYSGSYLGAALPALGPTETVTSAYLWLHVTGYAPFNGYGASAGLNSVGNAVPGTFIGFQSGWAITSISPGGTGWLQIDVTNAVNEDYTLGYGIAGFTVQPAGNGGGSSGLSFDAAGSSYAPYLQIYTQGAPVPEPGTWAMLIGAMGCLLYVRRRTATTR